MARFLPFQNGKSPLITVQTVAERNGTVPTEQALSVTTLSPNRISNILPVASRFPDEFSRANDTCQEAQRGGATHYDKRSRKVWQISEKYLCRTGTTERVGGGAYNN